MHYCKVELLFRNITVIRILQKKQAKCHRQYYFVPRDVVDHEYGIDKI